MIEMERKVHTLNVVSCLAVVCVCVYVCGFNKLSQPCYQADDRHIVKKKRLVNKRQNMGVTISISFQELVK